VKAVGEEERTWDRNTEYIVQYEGIKGDQIYAKLELKIDTA
jgi:hypothetical protein